MAICLQIHDHGTIENLFVNSRDKNMRGEKKNGKLLKGNFFRFFFKIGYEKKNEKLFYEESYSCV